MLPWTNSQLNVKKKINVSRIFGLYFNDLKRKKIHLPQINVIKRGQKLRADVQQSTRCLLGGLAEAQEGNQIY